MPTKSRALREVQNKDKPSKTKMKSNYDAPKSEKTKKPVKKKK